jgi:RNA polymerase sigma factor (sigma-70 family)
VQTALAKDWTGLEELRKDLRCFLARRCADENELEDIIQETYLRAARYRTGAKPVRKLRSWILSIARNVLLDRKRRQDRFQSLNHEDPELDRHGGAQVEEDGEDCYRLDRWTLDRDSAVQHLDEALGYLREGDRRVLSSFYGSGENSRTTARDCAIPAHLVKIRLFRARQRLLKALRRRLALRFALEDAAAPGSVALDLRARGVCDGGYR